MDATTIQPVSCQQRQDRFKRETEDVGWYARPVSAIEPYPPTATFGWICYHSGYDLIEGWSGPRPLIK